MHLAQAIIAAGGAKDESEAFDKFLTRGSAHYVERENITPHEAVEVIIAAGGVASIAHPGKDERILDLILALKQLGLGGIEAYHRMHSEEIVQLYVEFAERHDLILTGGSDCHGPYKEYAATAGTIPVPQSVLERLREKWLAQSRLLST